MIVWFNCKISDIRPNPQPRFNLRNDNRFDIARYSFASFAALAPLVTKFVFNLEMADGHAGQEAAMEAWLRRVLPEDKLVLEWYRCNNLAQWRDKQTQLHSYGDPIIFPAGNEDHVFVDSGTEVLEQGLSLLKTAPRETVIMTSHYPENIRAVHGLGGQRIAEHWAQYSMVNNDAIRIMHMEFFDWYLDQIKDPNKFFFRTEHWNDVVIPQNQIMVPLREQFRHFDGYAHVKISPDVCPPMEIPVGFFDGMTLKYGFDQRDEDAVNIMPAARTLRATDPAAGADFNLLLEDIPAFWHNHVQQIINAGDLDTVALEQARDQHLMDLTRIEVNWWHIGKIFGSHNTPPSEWFSHYLRHPQRFRNSVPDTALQTRSFGSSLSSI